jgi:aquaporin Z
MTDATAAPAPLRPPTLAQKLSAEALGTFVLVLFGVGAAAVTQGGDYAAIGLAFGIAIVAMVYAFGRISGGHFNPAVSVGAALGGRISWKEAGLYCAAQIGGALVGGFLLVLMFVAGDTGVGFGDDAFGANGFGDRGGFDVGGALLIEIVMTFIFLTVILAVTDTRNEHPALAPLAIGLSLAAIHFASMAATGTSVNPARSLSTVFFSGGEAIEQIWLFIIAPLVGGALAGLAYPALFGRDTEPVPGSGLSFAARPARAAVPGYGAPDQYQQQWNQQIPGYPQAQQAAPAPDQYQRQWNQQAWTDPQRATTAPAAQAALPGQGAQAEPAAQAAQPAQPVEQPIIQDGWQWDPQAQQWIPAQQQPPAP